MADILNQIIHSSDNAVNGLYNSMAIRRQREQDTRQGQMDQRNAMVQDRNFNEDIKVRNSVKRMLTEGRTAEANDLLQRRGNEYLEAEIADKFKANMNKLTQASRAVQASSMTAEEKRKQLDEIKKLEIGLASMYREIGDKTIRLSNPF
jgi:AAA15 family ATPase/GTPase